MIKNFAIMTSLKRTILTKIKGKSNSRKRKNIQSRYKQILVIKKQKNT